MAKKTKVKLALGTLTIADKLTLGSKVVTSMTNNATYVTPVPALSGVTTAVSNLDTAVKAAKTARDVAIAKTSAQDDREAELDSILTQLGHYIESTSGGDATKIKSAGVNTREDRTPVGEMGQPQNLDSKPISTGVIRLKWKKMKGAVSYAIEISPDPIAEKSWTHAGVSTKATFDFKDLKSGVKYWFHVAAVGAAGQGPWSDPATKYAI